MDDAIERTREIMEAGKKVNPGIFFLAHGGPINTPEDVRVILDKTDVHGFVGASSLERMGVERSLTDLTRKFKSLTLQNKK
jgi:predicted TIM-barrel enzyme